MSLRPIGIDLGTTNTVLAELGRTLTASGQPPLVVMPSVVSYHPDGVVRVGAEARARRAIDPRNTISSAKRVIGERWGSYRYQRYREIYPYDFVETPDGFVGFRTRAGIQDPRTVASEIVRSKLRIHDVRASQVKAFVAVPAAFDTAARTSTAVALARNELGEVHLIDEPIAVAIAYLERSTVRRAAVYDLGGGTFDVAILDCEQHPFRVLAFSGDAFLGGDDIDYSLARSTSERVLERYGWDLHSDREVFDRLLGACERAKCELSEKEVSVIDVASLDAAAPAAIEPIAIARSTLETVSRELVQRTFALCDRVLDEASLHTRDIDAVFVAGGATLLPGLWQSVEKYFGKRPRHDIHPMHVVAVGASLAAARPDLGRAVQSVFAR
jgi:molecular chaperone DnaK